MSLGSLRKLWIGAFILWIVCSFGFLLYTFASVPPEHDAIPSAFVTLRKPENRVGEELDKKVKSDLVREEVYEEEQRIIVQEVKEVPEVNVEEFPKQVSSIEGAEGEEAISSITVTLPPKEVGFHKAKQDVSSTVINLSRVPTEADERETQRRESRATKRVSTGNGVHEDDAVGQLQHSVEEPRQNQVSERDAGATTGSRDVHEQRATVGAGKREFGIRRQAHVGARRRANSREGLGGKEEKEAGDEATTLIWDIYHPSSPVLEDGLEQGDKALPMPMSSHVEGVYGYRSMMGNVWYGALSIYTSFQE